MILIKNCLFSTDSFSLPQNIYLLLISLDGFHPTSASVEAFIIHLNLDVSGRLETQKKLVPLRAHGRHHCLMPVGFTLRILNF